MRKAQIQMFETIAVLLVFFILVAAGFIFYGKIRQDDLVFEKEETMQLRSIAIAQRIMFLPELQCSDDNIVKDNCIDLLKLEAANTIMESKQSYYYDMFEFSQINITQIYPVRETYGLYLRETSYKTKFTTNIPISLFNPSTNDHSFGVLTIETYSK